MRSAEGGAWRVHVRGPEHAAVRRQLAARRVVCVWLAAPARREACDGGPTSLSRTLSTGGTVLGAQHSERPSVQKIDDAMYVLMCVQCVCEREMCVHVC